MKTPLQQKRILAWQCPLCGKEAAPWRLCYDHRLGVRLYNALRNGVRVGSLKRDEQKRYFIGDPNAKGRWGSAPIHVSETDKRGRPRLRGISVDVEATLVAIITRIGRPCTIEEISEAWGRLRDRRSSPLASDLATIIAAKDKRAAKMARRAAAQSGAARADQLAREGT
jgi:hypothetical protein